MLRSKAVVALVVAVAGALVGAGIVVVAGRSGPAPAAASAPSVEVRISIGAVTSQATRIAVAGHSYPLQPERSGSRAGTVALTGDAGGVAVVHDQAGHVLATAPVWAVPGQPAKATEVTCRSTAFDQFLLTPGVAASNPLEVDLLWSLAWHGQTGRDVAALGRLICAGLAADPGQLSHPSRAEIVSYRKVYLDYTRELAKLAAQMPPLEASIATTRVALTGDAPADGVQLTSFQTAADNRCAGNLLPVVAAPGPTTPLALCTDGRDVDAENNSAAWAFLYRTLGDDNGANIPGLPSVIVPGRTSDFPSIGKILGALTHDYIVAPAKRASCAILKFATLDICKGKKPSESEASKLFNLVEAGTARTQAGAGYYSIAWGNGEGNQSSFPAGATGTAVQTIGRYSEDLTFVSSVIVPTIGLILDHQLEEDLGPDQLSLLLPVFNDLTGSALQFGVNGAPTTMSGQLHAVVDTALSLFSNPGLLGDIMGAFFPDVTALGTDLAEQLAEYLAGLEVPVAGWAALLVKLVAKGSSAATLVLSIAGMFQALTEPSFSSWTPVLTAGGAFRLPLFTPTATFSCPAPAAPVAVPVGAPGIPRCEWVTKVDLNGNGRPDRLVTWETQDQRGAVAYLDDLTTEPLQAQSVLLQSYPWEKSGSDNYGNNEPLAVAQLTNTPRQEVLVVDYNGAVGDDAVIIGLGDDGHLHLVTDQTGQAYGVRTAADLGCASQSGGRLFTESGLGRGEPGGSTGSTPGYGISQSFFKITPDLRLHFWGYRGQIVPSAPPADPYRNGCGPSLAQLPAAGTLDPWAANPRLAVAGLIAAAAAKDPARASAFLAGAEADFSESQGMAGDAWQYLTATPGINPVNWEDRPVRCSTSTYDSRCWVIGANGDTLRLDLATGLGPNWVVTALADG